MAEVVMSDAGAPSVGPAMTPVPHRVRSRMVENRDTATLVLEPVAAALPAPRPGQFSMLYASGVGEIAVSSSGDPASDDGMLTHTVRAVGAVSRALHDAAPGTPIGVRGPFGTDWGLAAATGRDLLVVAGGVGLAPLRPLVLAALANRDRFGRLTLVAGARSQQDFLFAAELEHWRSGGRLDVHVTVDVPVQGWRGEVGVVTEPVHRLNVRSDGTTAFVCGPEPMMRAVGDLLLQRGMQASDIRVSLERNMQCGVGWCGHCQLGPLLLCRDGPVVGYDIAAPLLEVAEL